MPSPEFPEAPDIPEEDEIVVEPAEPEVPEPELSDRQIAALDELKEFFANYTTYIVQYIEKNAIYFSYNQIDFCIAVNTDLSADLQRKKYDIGDFEVRSTYKIVDFNAMCNDIDRLYFCDSTFK